MTCAHSAFFLICVLAADSSGAATGPLTSLADGGVEYRVAREPYVILHRANVQAVIVDNQGVDDEVLPNHREGYNGIARLTHVERNENLFVPLYSGFNFEAIHDGRNRELSTLFEPRRSPMELRIIDQFTCELYQAPTPIWRFESCHRYQILVDGAIEISFECKPQKNAFNNEYFGLQWASYIEQPESADLYFRGHRTRERGDFSRWIRAHSPRHGELSTHLGTRDQRDFSHDVDFPFTLLFSRSEYRFSEPWYFGKSHGMALVKIFRPEDNIRFSQSPSGGGYGNAAWDYQLLVSPCSPGTVYQMVMRVIYTPYESFEKLEQLTRHHREALGHGG